MEQRSIITELSESEDFDSYESDGLPVNPNQNQRILENNYEYNDIYFDRSYRHPDEFSVCNVSNLPKDIDLDCDGMTEDIYVIQPYFGKNPQQQIGQNDVLQLEKEGWIRINSKDIQVLHEASITSQQTNENYSSDYMPTLNWNSSQIEVQKIDGQNLSNQFVEQRLFPNKSNFNKDEGKIIFKITRVNKNKGNETLLTKSKRIISKWPHTCLRYYAKGMCKKCYHSYGREKKANIWPHPDKPLYAKGYCKHCYLSRYKQQTYVKVAFRHPRTRRNLSHINTKQEENVVTTNSSV